jgi:hypothetical protein
MLPGAAYSNPNRQTVFNPNTNKTGDTDTNFGSGSNL